MSDSLETLLINIEATGRIRSKQFALGPVARERFVKLAGFSVSAAATAWSDFLRLKGTKLHIPQVVIHDLPEFLDERLLSLSNPAPTSVFPTSGHIRHSGLEAIRKQADLDPITDEHREEMLDFVRNLGSRNEKAK